MNERRLWEPPLPEAPGFEHHLVETPGLRTHVATIGEGEPVLMLHGFPQHWWQWRTIAPRVAAAGYRVICPDFRGAGWTRADEPGFHRESVVDDLVALMDVMGVDRARVVSHDFGCVVAYQLSYRHPERVVAAVQFAVPPAFMIFTPRLLPAFSHMPKLLMHHEGEPLNYLFSEKYLAEPLTDEEIDGYLRAHRVPEVSRAVRDLYRGLVIPEVMKLAAGSYRRVQLKPPTLAVFGREDHEFPEELVRQICRDHVRRADRFAVAFAEGASHFITDDAPDAVVRHTLDWFAAAAAPNRSAQTGAAS
ncbi:alpha/beta hydrolase [Microbacterium bovistercoris]|uniref:Alpha/beta hydrolase n=1 Tax=Microbacterium bovistercoris TaxID=2293570 RepID=A0A371NUC1_9MICO|nr:alpha/beta hydrolase [Microbacterium bovistercoris]REJ05968.1 alpha/beta hydrolase [Microbacterium bovistercoris]